MAASSSIPTNSPPPSTVTDSTRFLKALQDLLTSLGKELRVPTIGGTELNLHELFLKVSSREDVNRERHWPEVVASLGLGTDHGTIFSQLQTNQTNQNQYEECLLLSILEKSNIRACFIGQHPRKEILLLQNDFGQLTISFSLRNTPNRNYFTLESCVTKRIAELWKSLNVIKKQVYQEKSERDKECYRTEMDLYTKRITDVVPLQQLPQEVPLQQQLPQEVPLQPQLPLEVEEQSLVDTSLRL
ncbi:hypothetical protein PTKIN_Ptkin17bG0053200 [Pterospermum kingtungense]